MAQLNLVQVEELLKLRAGRRGKPPILADGTSEGKAAIFGSVVLLSAALQGFVEDVFEEASERKLGTMTPGASAKYKKTWDRWGNPSDQNIIRLFQRLGVEDVFDGVSWQGQGTAALKSNLNHINQVRNRIAHNLPIKIDGKSVEVGYLKVYNWVKISKSFGTNFSAHVRKVIP